MSKIPNLLRYILDFVYPYTCLICGEKINLTDEIHEVSTYNKNDILNIQLQNTYTSYKKKSDKFICMNCKQKIEFVDSTIDIMRSLNDWFLNDSLVISNAISFFRNSADIPIINLVYHLKYYGLYSLGYEYGKWLGKLLKEKNMIDYDCIIPVPLHKRKKKERGYNQSDYIANGISKIIQKPVQTTMLQRTRYTISQTQLSSKERLHNLTEAFKTINKEEIKGKRILLVDDVLTTGSTLNNCAITLLEAAANRVDVATLIKA